MTNITKEAVLRAATKGTPEEALKELFPQYFEEEDTLAIKKGVFDSGHYHNLGAFCRKAFGDETAIMVARHSENGTPAYERSLVVDKAYSVVVRKSTHGNKTTIEIHRRK